MENAEPRSAAALQARGDVSLSRVSLPFAMALAFGGFLVAGGYTVGGVMSGIARDKHEVEVRLGAIEREIGVIRNILTERALAGQKAPPACRCR